MLFFLQNMRQPQWGMAQLVKRRFRVGDVQPIWKICASQIGSSPQMKIKNMWNHLVIWFPSPWGLYTHKDSLLFFGWYDPNPKPHSFLNNLVKWRVALWETPCIAKTPGAGFRSFFEVSNLLCWFLAWCLSDQSKWDNHQPGCASTNLSLPQWGLEYEYTNT